ncbi:MAG: hypothetical protein Q27BB25_00835 [Blastomonas sp. CACIA14H2]|nr:MAG: hypothetical protein Q27BB25_00835 [Blastomonas sp. CACIA14H2]
MIRVGDGAGEAWQSHGANLAGGRAGKSRVVLDDAGREGREGVPVTVAFMVEFDKAFDEQVVELPGVELLQHLCAKIRGDVFEFDKSLRHRASSD